MVNWKTFTPEQIEVLRANPYVKRVTPYMISFTIACKDEYCTSTLKKANDCLKSLRALD